MDLMMVWMVANCKMSIKNEIVLREEIERESYFEN